jgi:hypothetical protein
MGFGVHYRSLRARPHFVDLACCVLLIGLAALLSVRVWTGPIRWTPDGVAYQAKIFEARGTPPAAAMRRAYTVAIATKADHALPVSESWFAHAMQFYRRRILVPRVAALIEPIFGARTLVVISLASFALLGAALYVFLRLRFSALYAFVASAAALCFPPLERWSFDPLTDSAGLLLLVVALCAAVLTIERSRWWLVLWAVALGAGSITRETVAAPVIAAAFLVVRRVPRAIWLLATAIVVVAPALLLLRYPFTLAFAEATSRNLGVPVDASIGSVLRHWPHLALREVYGNFVLAPFSTVALVLPTVWAFLDCGPSAAARVARAAAVGSALYLVSFPFLTGLRLELVFVPVAAYGLALIAQEVVARAPDRLPRSGSERAQPESVVT